MEPMTRPETIEPTSSRVNVRQIRVREPWVLAGVVTGQIAGLIMAAFMILGFGLFLNRGYLFPVQVIGSAAFGESAVQSPTWGAILAGLLLHQLGPALLWGAFFGYLAQVYKVRTVGGSIMLGLIVGAVAMVIGPYILVPAMMKALHGVDIWSREIPGAWDWAAHLVYGASFGFYPAWLNRLERGRRISKVV